MIEDIKNGLKLASGVVDLAKNIKELSEKSGSLELKDAAAELRSQTIDLKETVNDMRGKIADLEKQLEFKQQLNWNGKTFDYEKNAQKVYICNGCEPKGVYTHMTEMRNERGYHEVVCPVCDNKVILNKGEQIKVNRVSRARGWVENY